jgi:hypothetical protein
MQPPQERLTEADVRSFLSSLAFIREYAITVVSIIPGQVTIELPFHERFSGPPGQFPASCEFWKQAGDRHRLHLDLPRFRGVLSVWD